MGADTDLVTKAGFKLAKTRIEKMFDYIESQDQLKDIVVSGGDAYYLPPQYVFVIEFLFSSCLPPSPLSLLFLKNY